MTFAVDVFANSRGHTEDGSVHLALVAPPGAEDEDWTIEPPLAPRDAEKINLLERVRALDVLRGAVEQVPEASCLV